MWRAASFMGHSFPAINPETVVRMRQKGLVKVEAQRLMLDYEGYQLIKLGPKYISPYDQYIPRFKETPPCDRPKRHKSPPRTALERLGKPVEDIEPSAAYIRTMEAKAERDRRHKERELAQHIKRIVKKGKTL